MADKDTTNNDNKNEDEKKIDVPAILDQIQREMLYLNPHLGYTPILLRELTLHAVRGEEGKVAPSPLIYELATKLRPACTKNEADLYSVLREVHERLANHQDPEVQGAIAWLEEEAL